MAASFKAILLAGLATASVWAMPATAGPAGFSATAAIELAQPSVELIASRKG